MAKTNELEFDVVIVGAGPAGLSAACRLLQQNAQKNRPLSVCIVEKGPSVGAQVLSGALLEPSALSELFPDWKERNAPVQLSVNKEEMLLLKSAEEYRQIPGFLQLGGLKNRGNYCIRLGTFCQWLAREAQALGAKIMTHCSARSLLIEQGQVHGVMINKGAPHSDQKLHAKTTLLCEGARGSLGKQAIRQFGLTRGRDPQHYALGIKELWKLPAGTGTPGHVTHSLGWPLTQTESHGGGFVYHLEEDLVAVGLVVDLCYRNPHLDPFQEFQRYKTHPAIRKHLEGGERIAFGAQSQAKGGLQSLPKMEFPGGLLLGDDAGTLNAGKFKGIHCAMRSGMLAADALLAAPVDTSQNVLEEHTHRFSKSPLYKELYRQRNIVPYLHRFGFALGATFSVMEDALLAGHVPWTLHDTVPDFAKLKTVQEARPPSYPRPDQQLTFDRASSIALAHIQYQQEQSSHLKMLDPDLPLTLHLQRWQEPAQRFCPAGVYEVVYESHHGPTLEINPTKCLHCKACDIKDPSQNIRWTPPVGGDGPNYDGM